MRLVCPNCAAQYDVDDRVIPEGGRDVQCSNCGHSWFQTPAIAADRPRVRPVGTSPRPVAEPAAAPSPVARQAPERPTEQAPDQPGAPAPAAAGTAAGRGLPPVQEDEDWEDDEPIDHLPPARAVTGAEPVPAARIESALEHGRRVMDESVLSILREEAERETRARQAEARQSVEMQGDLGLPAPPASPPQRPDPAAPPRREPPRDIPARDRLPDVEEITSSLTAPGESAAAADGPAARRRSGFGLGFGIMLFLAVIAIAAYVLAPRISEGIPQLAGPMAAYVDLVDQGRIWLDAALRDLVAGSDG